MFGKLHFKEGEALTLCFVPTISKRGEGTGDSMFCDVRTLCFVSSISKRGERVGDYMLCDVIIICFVPSISKRGEGMGDTVARLTLSKDLRRDKEIFDRSPGVVTALEGDSAETIKSAPSAAL